MEEATGAPSSLADWGPKRLRASGRDGGAVMTQPPSPLTMLFSRHTKRREFITLLGGAAAWPLAARAQQPGDIPIVFEGPSDPVQQGFVASMARPGGNLTGFSSFEPSIVGKLLEALREIAPQTARVALMVHPDNPGSPLYMQLFETTVPSFRMKAVA